MVVKKDDDEDKDNFITRTQLDLGTDADNNRMGDDDLPTIIKSQKLREMLEKQKENRPTTIELTTEKINAYVFSL